MTTKSLVIAGALLSAGCALRAHHYSFEQARQLTFEHFGRDSGAVLYELPSFGIVNDSVDVWVSYLHFPSADERSVGAMLRAADGKRLMIGFHGPTPWRLRRLFLGGLRRAQGSDLGGVSVLYFGQSDDRRAVETAAAAAGVDLTFILPPRE
jgi:hypothetical protein